MFFEKVENVFFLKKCFFQKIFLFIFPLVWCMTHSAQDFSFFPLVWCMTHSAQDFSFFPLVWCMTHSAQDFDFIFFLGKQIVFFHLLDVWHIRLRILILYFFWENQIAFFHLLHVWHIRLKIFLVLVCIFLPKCSALFLIGMLPSRKM